MFLFAAGEFHAALVGLATFGILSLIPVYFWGIDIYQQWWSASQTFSGQTFPGNSSLISLFYRLGNPTLGLFLCMFIFLIVLYWVWRKRPDLPLVNSLAIVISLLCSPITWAGYTIFTLPIFYHYSKWSLSFKIAAVLLSIPFVVSIVFFELSTLTYVLVGNLYGWALLLLFFDLLQKLTKENDKWSGIPLRSFLPQ